MRAIPGITPLRALAAGLVLVSHVAFWSGASGIDGVGALLARGDSGVAVFFAISAYLLLRPAAHPEATWPPNRYAAKRTARILPAYWLALLGVLVVTSALAGGLGGPARVLRHVVLVQGFTLDQYRGFTQTWSLTTEVTFYLVVPLVGRWVRSCVRSVRSVVPGLTVVMVVGILVQAWSASWRSGGLGALSSSALGHAAWFAGGILVMWWHRDGDEAARQTCSPGRACGLAATCFVLVATPLGGPLGLTRPGFVAAGAKELLYTVIAGCLLHAASCTLTGRADALLRSPVAQTAGDVSYGVFLWHVLVIQVLFSTIGLRLFHAPFVLVLVPTVVFSVAVAWVSWRFVERPAIAWAHRRTPGRTSTLP